MIHHVSIGVRSAEKSKPFYDAALAPLGYERLSESEEALGYGGDEPFIWVQTAKHPVPADPDSGLHFCLSAPTHEAVDRFHAAALGNGGTDNGAPGLREDYGPNYYAAFVIDPDGYRLEACCNTP